MKLKCREEWRQELLQNKQMFRQFLEETKVLVVFDFQEKDGVAHRKIEQPLLRQKVPTS